MSTPRTDAVKVGRSFFSTRVNEEDYDRVVELACQLETELNAKNAEGSREVSDVVSQRVAVTAETELRESGPPNEADMAASEINHLGYQRKPGFGMSTGIVNNKEMAVIIDRHFQPLRSKVSELEKENELLRERAIGADSAWTALERLAAICRYYGYTVEQGNIDDRTKALIEDNVSARKSAESANASLITQNSALQARERKLVEALKASEAVAANLIREKNETKGLERADSDEVKHWIEQEYAKSQLQRIKVSRAALSPQPTHEGTKQ